jgi:hypothetical protein
MKHSQDQVTEAVNALPDDEATSLRIIQTAFNEAGVSRPFFGEAYEPGTVIASIVRQVAALAAAARSDCEPDAEGVEMRGRGNPWPATDEYNWSTCKSCGRLAHWGECRRDQPDTLADGAFLRWLAGVLKSREFQSELVADRLERIASRLKPDGELRGWQPIETAPNSTPCLVISDGWAWPCIGYFDGFNWRDNTSQKTFMIGPTHWMPLPEPPEPTP